MKKYIEELFSASRKCTCGVGFRAMWLLLVTAFAAGLPWMLPAAPYQNMGGGRILLMNNDRHTATQGGITGQNYYDTNTTAGVSYWTHYPADDNSTIKTRTLLHGTEHVLYSPEGEVWWQLVDCRAGHVVPKTANRNTLPFSSYAQISTPPGGATTTITTNGANACVFLRNSKRAGVYSPLYKEGIGTLYFDTVNSYAASDGDLIQVQIATNLTEAASSVGDIKFEDVHKTVAFDKWDDYYNWETLPLKVLEINNLNIVSEADGVTELSMAIADKGSAHFYRVRTQLNYYGPIRFRIKRVTENEVGVDNSYLVAIDNIIASYPPMKATLDRVGEDYDASLTGTSVLGCIGDFNKPFLTYADKTVNTRINFSWVTNFQGVAPDLRVYAPKLNYRWRYLDQKVNPWRTVNLTTNVNVTIAGNVYFTRTPDSTQLVSVAGIPDRKSVV